jgi:hypothetical protein
MKVSKSVAAKIRNNPERLKRLTLRWLDRLDSIELLRDEAKWATEINADAKDESLKDATLRHIAVQSIAKAAEEQDDKELARLVDAHSALTRLAFQQVLRQHIRGREVGDPRDTDIPPVLKIKLTLAKLDVKRIRCIWKDKLGFRNRSITPTPYEIAAERWGLNVEQLIRFR